MRISLGPRWNLDDRVLEAVDRGDVGMVERSQDAGFTPKPRPAIIIEWMALGENLDRDVAAKPRVFRAVDLTHAAGAEQLLDLIGAEPRTGHERVRIAAGRAGFSTGHGKGTAVCASAEVSASPPAKGASSRPGLIPVIDLIFF